MSTLANITSLNLSLQTGGAALAIKAVKSVAKPARTVYVFGTADDVAPNFTTVDGALTYANSLTPIVTEPVVIRLFTKADGTPYDLAGLSSWTTYANDGIYFVSDFVELNGSQSYVDDGAYIQTSPTGFTATVPFDIYKTPTGRFYADINPLSYIVATTETYYISQDGNDANDGLTPATAKKSLATLIDTLNLTPLVKRTIYIEGGNYAYVDSIGGHNIEFDFNLIAYNGQAVFTAYSSPTWALVGGTSNQYQWAGAGSGKIYSVYQEGYNASNGRPKPFMRYLASDSANVEANPGSMRIGGSGSLVVHTFDSVAPTSDTKVILGEGIIWQQTSAIDCYVSGVSFMGGDSTASQVNLLVPSGSARFFFNNCDFSYCVGGNGIRTQTNSISSVFTYKCTAHGNFNDGLNYNSESGTGTSCFEINTQAIYNGFDMTNANDNGSTNHVSASIVRVNSVCLENKDRNIHDINSTKNWMLGCVAGYARNADTDPYDNINFAVGRLGQADDAISWLDTCVSEGGSVADFGVFGAATMNHKNPVGAVEVEITDTGVYQRY